MWTALYIVLPMPQLGLLGDDCPDSGACHENGLGLNIKFSLQAHAPWDNGAAEPLVLEWP